MKGKSLKEWVDLYERKTKDKAEVLEGYRLFYLAERGFCTTKPDLEGKMLMIYQICGDLKFWLDYAELQAAAMQLDCVASVLVRHVEPYIRDFGWEILEREDVDGHYRYWCQDNIGRLAIITHKGYNEKTNTTEYWVTHYFNTKATSPLIEKMKEKLRKEGVLNE